MSLGEKNSFVFLFSDLRARARVWGCGVGVSGVPYFGGGVGGVSRGGPGGGGGANLVNLTNKARMLLPPP